MIGSMCPWSPEPPNLSVGIVGILKQEIQLGTRTLSPTHFSHPFRRNSSLAVVWAIGQE